MSEKNILIHRVFLNLVLFMAFMVFTSIGVVGQSLDSFQGPTSTPPNSNVNYECSNNEGIFSLDEFVAGECAPIGADNPLTSIGTDMLGEDEEPCQFGIKNFFWDSVVNGIVIECEQQTIFDEQVNINIGEISVCGEGEVISTIDVTDADGNMSTGFECVAQAEEEAVEPIDFTFPVCTGDDRGLQFDGSQFICSCADGGTPTFAFFKELCLASGESISDHLILSKIADGPGALSLGDSDRFGRAVTISSDGNTLFVGALLDDTGGADRGAVYEFSRSGNSWSQQSKIAHGTGGLSLNNGDWFGSSVAISQDGNTLFVGARQDDTGGADRGAVYEFSRSGNSWSQQSKIAHGTGGLSLSNGDLFGTSVAISQDGNTIFVGAWRDDTGGTNRGAVYEFTKSGNSWTQQSKIAHGNSGLSLSNNDRFGTSVAISQDGNTLFVGAPSDDTVGHNRGAIYVLSKSGNSWSQQSKIAHGTGGLSLNNGDWFGSSVAVSQDGNTLFVGARADDTGGTNRGAVYEFTKSGNSWTQQSKIAHGTGGLSLSNVDLFGSSVAISQDGNTIFVGAWRDDTGGTDRGAVFELEKSGNSWTQQSKIADGANGFSAVATFETDVAISQDGNTLFVSAPETITTGVFYTGAVYEFTKSGNSWSQQSRIAHGTGGLSLSNDDYFGASVAISQDGNTLFVGAQNDDTGGFDRGAVYVFSRSGNSWTEQSKIAHGNSGLSLSNSGNFGSSVAISPDGNTLFVGANRYISNAGGAVYVLSKSGNSWTQQSVIAHGTGGLSLAYYDSVDGSGTSVYYETFGSSIAISPDGNTLFVGASVENLVPFSLGDAPGAVYVFEKSGSSWTLQSKITDGNSGLSLSGFAKFGSDVAVSQDGNTLFVGAKTDITVGSGDGAVYVLSKSGNSWTQQSRIAHGTDGLSLEGRSGSSFVFNFGSAVAISPDGNTLFVGAEGDPTDLSNFGFGEVHILELE